MTKNNDLSVIARRIGDRRLQLRLSQAELAELAELEPSCISRYERGVTEPRAGTIISLARALNVSADYLLGLKRTKT